MKIKRTRKLSTLSPKTPTNEGSLGAVVVSSLNRATQAALSSYVLDVDKRRVIASNTRSSGDAGEANVTVSLSQHNEVVGERIEANDKAIEDAQERANATGESQRIEIEDASGEYVTRDDISMSLEVMNDRVPREMARVVSDYVSESVVSTLRRMFG